MNPFDDFDLDLVKITREVSAPRSCDDPLNGSGSGTSGPIATLSCTCASCTCTCPTEVTAQSACDPCSADPKCQTLEGRC